MRTLTINDGTGTYTCFDLLDASLWHKKLGPDINDPASADYLFAQNPDGALQVINEGLVNNAGGMIACDFPLVDGVPFVGTLTEWEISAEDFVHEGRHEDDVKATFVSAPSGSSPIQNQANWSCQWNRDRGQWDLDPSGKKWVGSGYAKQPIAGRNRLQMRMSTDYTKKTWTTTGLQLNDDPNPFVPSAGSFGNLPWITTNWTKGGKKQLQTMVEGGAPWYLRLRYTKCWVMFGTAPIPWKLF